MPENRRDSETNVDKNSWGKEPSIEPFQRLCPKEPQKTNTPVCPNCTMAEDRGKIISNSCHFNFARCCQGFCVNLEICCHCTLCRCCWKINQLNQLSYWSLEKDGKPGFHPNMDQERRFKKKCHEKRILFIYISWC